MTANTAHDLPYGLLELETGNMIGFFETEAAALAAVVDSLDRYGTEGVQTLALAHFVASDVEAIAEGEELIRLALTTVRVNGESTTTAPVAAETRTHAHG